MAIGPDELDPHGEDPQDPQVMWIKLADDEWHMVDKATGYRHILNGTARAFAVYRPPGAKGDKPWTQRNLEQRSKGLSRGIQLRNKVRAMSADTLADHLTPMAGDLENSDVPRLLDLFAEEGR